MSGSAPLTGLGEHDHGAAAQATGLHAPLRVGGLLGRIRLGDAERQHAPHGERPHLPSQSVRSTHRADKTLWIWMPSSTSSPSQVLTRAIDAALADARGTRCA